PGKPDPIPKAIPTPPRPPTNDGAKSGRNPQSRLPRGFGIDQALLGIVMPEAEVADPEPAAPRRPPRSPGPPGAPRPGPGPSPGLDATQISRFGKMHLHGSVAEGTSITVATRSGNVHEAAEKGWSKWTDEAPVTEFLQVQSPPAHFLQYRLTFTSNAGKATP